MELIQFQQKKLKTSHATMATFCLHQVTVTLFSDFVYNY